MVLSFSLPTMEIASGKEPMAFIFLGSRKFKIHCIKPYGPYFILNTPAVKGIFEMDSTKVYFYDKTACYFYDFRNPKPLDPLMVGELNYFADKNKLHKITRKDVKHGSLLRKMSIKTENKKDAIIKTEQISEKNQNKIDETMNNFFNSLEEQEKANIKAATKENPHMPITQEQVSYTLTKHLFEKDLITSDDKMLLDEDIRSGKMSFEQLIDDLREKEIVTIREPLSMDAERFLEAFHAYDPARVWNWVEKLATLDKRLKTMTSVPVKNWIPASLIMALAIGGSIGFIVIIQNIGEIQKQLGNLFPGSTVPVHTAKFLLGAFLGHWF